MKILFFGDIVGRIGITAVSSLLPKLVKEYSVDFVIANGENASNGKGLTERDYHGIVSSGVDVITLGNHWRSKDQIDDYIEDADDLIRPLNVLHYDKGVGSGVYEVNGIEIRVTNLLAQAFMKEEVASPHVALKTLLLDEPATKIHIVDFHGESTSEKAILAYAFDGEVSAVIGTHTHVQTADAQILEKGTGFISDVGMCGAADSVIGFTKESVMSKVLLGQNNRFEIAEEAPELVDAILIDVDEITGLCRGLQRLSYIDGRIRNA